MLHANCRNTPVEIFETRYPWLHHEYSLDEGTAGSGEHRGGLGVRRDLEVLGDLITISVLADRGERAPQGILGGAQGSLTKVLVKRAGRDEFKDFREGENSKSLTKFVNVRLKRGDVVRLVSPSGGGYGDALRRDPELVLTDVKDRFISREQALKDYGVLISQDLKLDVVATQTERNERR